VRVCAEHAVDREELGTPPRARLPLSSRCHASTARSAAAAGNLSSGTGSSRFLTV
jgi:hypothetical protein